MLNNLLNATTVSSALRLSIPLTFAAIGGAFSDRAGVFNIALECFMLCSAFFTAVGTFLSANPYIGILCGILASLVCAGIFGIFVFHLKSSAIVVSIALNSGAGGLTTLLMIFFFGTRGSFVHERLVSLPNVTISIFERSPFLSKVFNGQNILLYLSFACIIIMWFVMYHTTFGLRLRGVGMNAAASQTIGINVTRYKWYATLITGIFCGIGGAVLPIGGTSIFSENMTAGRGFLAVAAIMVGKGNPLLTGLFCILFAYADAVSLTLQNLGIPSQLVETLPYLTTVLVLVFAGIRKTINEKKRIRTKKA